MVKVRPISVAVLAIGGEGGGVLADWIAGLAEHNGYAAQTTSVPGVAQRTGATIYYIEMFPLVAAKAAGREPVFALMPVPGDVDIVIASELMEAARAVERGLVTPDRTTLIASTHRVYAMSERTALADGRADAAKLIEACRSAAHRFIAFDMEAIAEAAGSVASAVLFGALAGASALPFQRTAFETAIRRSGVGVAASLAAFAAGFEAAADGETAAKTAEAAADRTAGSTKLDTLLGAFAHGLSPDTAALIRAGVARLADYQDLDYAREYLNGLRPFRQIDLLLGEVARQLALAMGYEDTIRVADLKIRPERFARVREEVKLADGQILEIAEFLHPRTEEIADTLPAGLGRWLLGSRWARRFVDRFTRSGRTVKTTSIRGFLLLYLMAALRPLRRRSLRFARERASIEAWLALVAKTAERDYELALGVAGMRGLIKGYGDTHERGHAKYLAMAECVPNLLNRADGAEQLARLHKAALADEHGDALRAAIREIGR